MKKTIKKKNPLNLMIIFLKDFIAYSYKKWEVGSSRGASNVEIPVLFHNCILPASYHGSGDAKIRGQAPKLPLFGNFWGSFLQWGNWCQFLEWAERRALRNVSKIKSDPKCKG